MEGRSDLNIFLNTFKRLEQTRNCIQKLSGLGCLDQVLEADKVSLLGKQTAVIALYKQPNSSSLKFIKRKNISVVCSWNTISL